MAELTHVEKACAYVTRNDAEVLTFRGPGHDGLQIPKGTVESGERPREALCREVVEESGLATFASVDHLATDVWQRRADKRYVRHFYHVRVHEPRDRWTHTVTGSGEERGAEFAFSWNPVPVDERFALDLDDYLHALPVTRSGPASESAAAD